MTPTKMIAGQDSNWHVGRKHPAHHPVIGSGNQAAIVFVTVNTHQRKLILAKRDVAEALHKAWREADTWLVGRYVIMPDHIHFFCAPRELSVNLKHWMKYWKSRVSLRWPRPAEQPIWQLDFWDTQLRQVKIMMRNGITSGAILSGKDWSQNRRIGLMLAK